jgi:hypothetical protein
MTFDRRKFIRRAHQLHTFVGDYRKLGLSTDEAAAWANHGFTPDEAKPWIAAGFTPDEASKWADNFVSAADARAELNRRAAR